MNSTTLWPLFKIVLVFTAILLGIRCKAGIGTSILAGSFLLALLFGITPMEWLAMGIDGVVHEKVILLALVILLILYMSELLEQTGQGRRLMHHVSKVLIWPRLRLVFFPALIGLLPMPGGAIFSAPMIKDMAAPYDLQPRQLVLLNYWFRHVWELCWPLYPGIILAAYVADVSLARLLSLTWPGVVLTIGLGWFFFLRPGVLPLSVPPGSSAPASSGTYATLLWESLPLCIAVLGGLVLEGLVVLAQLNLPMEWGFILALLAAMACIIAQNRLGPTDLWPIFKKPHAALMLFMVAAIFVFKSVLEQGGIVQALAGSVTTPQALFWIALALPLIVGLISGLTVAFVGGTLPLVYGLAAQLHVSDPIGYAVLVLFAGYVGILASPLHVCLILSCGYFQAGMDSVMKKLVAPCALMLGFSAGYALLLL